MSIIETVFIRNIIMAVIIVLILGGVFFLIRLPIKWGTWPKWSYAIYAAVTLVVLTLLSINLMNIYLDIKEEAYITYQGNYIERGGGQRDLKTVVVYDTDGREIRLLRTGMSKTGEYIGTVVYGKRSKIVVEYNGIPKD